MSDEGKPTPPGDSSGTEPKLEPMHVSDATPSETAQPVSPASEEPTLGGGPSPLIAPPSGNGDWKARVRAMGARLQQSRWARDLGARIQAFEPARAADWAGQAFQRQDADNYLKAATIALCAFFLADLAALLAGRYIPEPPVARLSRSASYHRAKILDDYNIVFTRNLFSSAGVIPGEESTQGAPTDQGGPPVKTSLPFNLIGTVILRDELRSLATIEDKSAGIVYPVRQEDEIPSKIKVLKIEVRKVIFINVATGRREYVDLPDDGMPPITATRVSIGRPGGGGPGIEKISPTQFNVQRTEVDKALQDFNKVLTEARAVPNFENGAPAGYKLFQIVPGSIYDKLGLQNGDIITGLNGSLINDPGKAFEMLSELKTSNHLELQIKKNGKVQSYTYDIR